MFLCACVSMQTDCCLHKAVGAEHIMPSAVLSTSNLSTHTTHEWHQSQKLLAPKNLLSPSTVGLANDIFSSQGASFYMVDTSLGTSGVIGLGNYQVQESPCSTFKIALSLMGFDSGFLKNTCKPVLPYQTCYQDERELCRQPQTPASWIRNSCIWYSRAITARLGFMRFSQYVNDFSYGNQNVTGDPEKNNGLTQAWLCSSLKISPREQVEFIQTLLRHGLPVSEDSYAYTKQLLFVKNIQDNWQLYGKTGGGVAGNTRLQWFIGWLNCLDGVADHGPYIFACLYKTNIGEQGIGGNRAKQAVLDFFDRALSVDNA